MFDDARIGHQTMELPPVSAGCVHAGIIACEACDKINQRQTIWAAHPHVNQAQFVPEWIRALSAPQSPAEYVEQIAWHYGQGGPQVFFGDIAFYSGEWDARERVGRIDTKRCRLFMLTGEYDYSCTVELSEATAAKISGVRFKAMQGIGHFPFAENPKRFAQYLLPILAELKGDPRYRHFTTSSTLTDGESLRCRTIPLSMSAT
jgi:pimeloyl-ACP methyl ester carboxylesterase